MQAYVALVNDMDLLAAAHHVACVVSVQGAKEDDVEKSAVPLDLDGVREIRLVAAFSGLGRRGVILSLLDAVSNVEQAEVVVLRKVHYEKEVLTFELSVIGL